MDHAGSFLASQVPKELFDRIGWNYGTYRIVVFSVLVFAIVLLVWLWAGTRAVTGRETRVSAICEAVLTYLTIMYERGEDPRGVRD